jgi:hypothetical protein
LHAAFQQLDVDYFIGPPNQQLYRTDLSEVPILRMYGVTEQGKAFCRQKETILGVSSS